MSNQSDRPDIPKDEYDRPMSGGDLPPLDLLPEREWLRGRIVNVEYRYAMFNGKVQYVTKKKFDQEANKEIDVPVLDKDDKKIARKEFNIKFELVDYCLPNDKGPRCNWLTLGASMGDRSHLPTFLENVLGDKFEPDSPKDVIEALRGRAIQLQLKNKPNTKDRSKPPYQNVIYDAVKARPEAHEIENGSVPADQTETMPENQVEPEDATDGKNYDGEGNEIAWDE